jgi:cysteine desulfurase
MSKPIYLDYMATTPLDAEVLAEMLPFYTETSLMANPGSLNHSLGQGAFRALESYRERFAACINAVTDEVIFTSGATEANNIAIFGAAHFYSRQGKHLITAKTEHKAVLNVFEELEKQGFSVSYLTPDGDGLIALDKIMQALRPDTILCSFMQVNNEIGVIQDIAAIASLLKSKGVLLHVDAAQSFGPLGTDVCALGVDLMSFSAHKVYGPKGVGALYLRQKPRIQLKPILFGGGQEKGLRPGTQPLALIAGMTCAFEKMNRLRKIEIEQLQAYRLELETTLREIEGIQFNGSLKMRVANNLNFSIRGVDGSALMPALHPLMLSSQSACQAALGASSHVLKAIGIEDYLARASVRLSLGRMTTSDEIQQTKEILKKEIPRLREIN